MSIAAGEPHRDNPSPPPLAVRIAAGERAAEAEFVRLYQSGVRALVRRHCRPNDPAVDDLVQEILHHVLQRLRAGELRDPAALPAYVRQAVVFNTTAEYRKRGRRGEDETVPVDDSLPGGTDPAHALDREQTAAAVRALLAELNTARDREILLRFYVREQSKDEVCAATGVDPAHFHRVIFRARGRLRELALAAGLGR